MELLGSPVLTNVLLGLVVLLLAFLAFCLWVMAEMLLYLYRVQVHGPQLVKLGNVQHALAYGGGHK